jgi:hypothetical protein
MVSAVADVADASCSLSVFIRVHPWFNAVFRLNLFGPFSIHLSASIFLPSTYLPPAIVFQMIAGLLVMSPSTPRSSRRCANSGRLMV